MEMVTVIKLNAAGAEQWRWPARLLERGDTHLCVEAFFNRDDSIQAGFTFQRGDRFVEWYYTDRLYNLFEIHEPASGALRAWYINFSRPARFETTGDGLVIQFEDLALDLLVLPDGTMQLLDEDEFADLHLSAEEHGAVLRATSDVRAQIDAGLPPFTRDPA